MGEAMNKLIASIFIAASLMLIADSASACSWVLKPGWGNPSGGTGSLAMKVGETCSSNDIRDRDGKLVTSLTIAAISSDTFHATAQGAHMVVTAVKPGTASFSVGARSNGYPLKAVITVDAKE